MSFWHKNSGLLWFCALAFVGSVGASAVVAAAPPGEPVPASEQRTSVRSGGSSVLFINSRRRYHRRHRGGFFGTSSRGTSASPSRSGRSSTRRGSVGNRSYRGGGLFGGK